MHVQAMPPVTTHVARKNAVAHASGSIRVLLVHDQALVGEGLRLLLESTGEFAVSAAAGDGREAVALMRKRRPGVVVVCAAMPELLGIRSARQIRDAFPRMKIVVLLMRSAPYYVEQLLDGRGLGHVVRAASAAELLSTVHAVHGARPDGAAVPHPSPAPPGSFPRISSRRNPLRVLSRREREVLRLVVAGRSSRFIATRLQIAASTVDTHRSRMVGKLGLDSRAALVKFALDHGVAPRA